MGIKKDIGFWDSRGNYIPDIQEVGAEEMGLLDIKDIENKIINADCMDILKQLPDKCIDLVLTDPPYVLDIHGGGNNFCRKSAKKIENELSDIKNGFDIILTFEQLKRICKKFNMFCFCSDKQIVDIILWAKNNNYIYTLLVWDKINSPPFCNGTWLPDCEFIVHIRESGAKFDGDAKLKKKISRINSPKHLYGHPTQKPIELITKYIKLGSDENDLVLDCFSGSGTTAVACHNLKRRFICIEKDKDYWKASVERLKNAQAQQKLF